MTRPRLQLHLSTLLIVTLLVAGLVWLNVRAGVGQDMGVVYFYRGWPWIFQEWMRADPSKCTTTYDYLLSDLVTGILLVLVAAAAIEWATRRMKRGAPN